MVVFSCVHGVASSAISSPGVIPVDTSDSSSVFDDLEIEAVEEEKVQFAEVNQPPPSTEETHEEHGDVLSTSSKKEEHKQQGRQMHKAPIDHNVDERETEYHVCPIFCRPNQWVSFDQFCDAVPSRNCQVVPPHMQQKLNLVPNVDHGFICESKIDRTDGETDIKHSFVRMRFHERDEAFVQNQTRKLEEERANTPCYVFAFAWAVFFFKFSIARISLVWNSVPALHEILPNVILHAVELGKTAYGNMGVTIAPYLPVNAVRILFPMVEVASKTGVKETGHGTVEAIPANETQKGVEDLNAVAHVYDAWDLSNATAEGLDEGRFASFCRQRCDPFPHFQKTLNPLKQREWYEKYEESGHSIAVRDPDQVTMKHQEICNSKMHRMWMESFFDPGTQMMMAMPLVMR